MYNQVHAVRVRVQCRRYATITSEVKKDQNVYSVRLKMAGAGVSGPFPGSVPSVGGGGGADLPEGAGSLLSKYLLKSPASSKGRLPSKRTMLYSVSQSHRGTALEYHLLVSD